ncbi:hypothetical protein TELCIR_10405 [Teladorsagia circumcincta]|uniref:Uncharacterized protein n=1 Tax=Teladorsagia circumcincta TaxID=45464 RepID=A0A2G9UC75_TELCI|nr:hypothetical protein TELCIR_10405 [Teladorsagia circumcincta]
MAILCVGFADFWYRGFPGFYPLAMLGGVLWTMGNTTAIPLIKRIGLGLGILLWNSSKCVVGWVTGRGGAFSMVEIDRQIPETQRIRAGKSKESEEASKDSSEAGGSSQVEKH